MNQNYTRKTSSNRNSERYTDTYRRNTYENGNAVRRAQTAPKRQPERVPAMNMRQISNLETQISELKTTNDASEKRLDTTMNLETIKEKAQKDLGMSYADSDQIVYYSVDNTDYMNQYGSVD